jgi:hypothetical protein
MAVTSFNTSNQTFRKLLGNGLVYRVPMFQRDYSWSEEEWDDLWQDTVATLEPGGEQGHYLGYLVLQSGDDRNFDIIDGQQRVTTLSLLILAVLKNLQRLVDLKIEAEDNLRRLEELRKTYIGFVDPVTLITTPKLTLNRHNNQLYQTYLVPLHKAPRRNLKASEHLLRKAFEWFDERVKARFDQVRSGAELARFVDNVADRLFFTAISVNDELNAFRVFETLNSRGVRLSSTDLLKNYLFSVVHGAGGHDHEIRTLEERWEAIVDKLGSEAVPDFLRVFWNSQHPLTRHADLFKTIRGSIKDKGGVFSLVRDMDRDADLYAALSDPSDPTWSDEQRGHVRRLAMFNIRQPYALLLAARRVLNDSELARVLRACVIVSFRYNIIGGLSPSEQERVYNDVASGIARGALKSAMDVIKALRPVYPSDDQFRAAFVERQIRTTSSRNRQIARYVLFQIEEHISGNAHDPDSKRYSIEHILPEHPDDSWSAFNDEQIDRSIYRLGNMTPLSVSANRNVGNGPYADKSSLYARSEFELTRRVAAENESWNAERVRTRQAWMAAQATGIWRLSELD